MTQLIGRYERPLYRFIYQLVGDAHLAEDLFQETFLRLHSSRGQFAHGSKLKPYVFRIALHAVYDFRRRKSRRMRSVSLDAEHKTGNEGASASHSLNDSLPHPAPGPLRNSEQREVEGLVRDAVQALPHTEREVVLLRVFEGLSFAEIAEMTGVPLATAKSRMLYALRRLRPALETNVLQSGA